MAIVLADNQNFDYSMFENSSCAFGVFDGVHRGHQFLLSCAQKSAHENSGKSIALTFDSDPDEMFHPQRLRKLMTNADRIATLAQSGVDYVIVLPFTRNFAALSPLDFLERTFKGHVPESLHIGSDFCFGAHAKGTIKELMSWGEQKGMRVCAYDLQSVAGSPITSTRIRLLLAETQVEKAHELLGRPFFVRGHVQAGRGEGEGFGFRTANLSLAPQMQVLGEGVYAAYVEVEGIRYKAAASVGVSPTFKEEATASCEVHILDFEGDIYGDSIKVEFLFFLRPLKVFDSNEALIVAVEENISWVRENL